MIDTQNPFFTTTRHNSNYPLSKDDIKWGYKFDQFSNMDNYVIHKKIGRGRYSNVFQGTDKRTKQKVAIKVLLPIRKDKIIRQYQISQSLYHANICKIKDIVKSDNLMMTSIIFQYCPNQDFRQLYPNLSLNQIKLYTKQLFQGLNYLHSMNVMHRDIKPFNVMINTEKKKLKIIDFGLSQIYKEGEQYSDQVGSLYYRAPQLILGETKYDYKIDCWSAGMILAGMIFKKTPFLQGKDPIDQLIKLMKLLGTKNIVSFIKQKNLIRKSVNPHQNICLDVISAFETGQIIMAPKSSYQEFINKHNKMNCTVEALDLIEKLLTLDPSKRFSTKQALSHPFFSQ